MGPCSESEAAWLPQPPDVFLLVCSGHTANVNFSVGSMIGASDPKWGWLRVSADETAPIPIRGIFT